MTREEKDILIENLTAQLTQNNVIYLADLTGLNAVATTELRKACFKAGVKLVVAKNTFIAKAMEFSGKDFGELPKTLKGNTSLMYSEVGNAPARLIKEFRKKSDKPILKGAYVESDIFVGDNQLDTLATIKSREELIGDIIGLLQSPAKNVISALKASGGKLAGIVKTLSEK